MQLSGSWKKAKGSLDRRAIGPVLNCTERDTEVWEERGPRAHNFQHQAALAARTRRLTPGAWETTLREPGCHLGLSPSISCLMLCLCSLVFSCAGYIRPLPNSKCPVLWVPRNRPGLHPESLLWPLGPELELFLSLLALPTPPHPRLPTGPEPPMYWLRDTAYKEGQIPARLSLTSHPLTLPPRIHISPQRGNASSNVSLSVWEP